MYGMVLARMAGIKEFSILVVVVGHDWRKTVELRLPSEQAVGGSIEGAGERRQRAKL